MFRKLRQLFCKHDYNHFKISIDHKTSTSRTERHTTYRCRCGKSYTRIKEIDYNYSRLHRKIRININKIPEQEWNLLTYEYGLKDTIYNAYYENNRYYINDLGFEEDELIFV